jgi:hypothetical protein
MQCDISSNAHTLLGMNFVNDPSTRPNSSINVRRNTLSFVTNKMKPDNDLAIS